MSLDYNLTAIKARGEEDGSDWARLWDDEGVMRPPVQSIIFATMTTGIGRITDKNVSEFWARDVVWHHMMGFKDGPSYSPGLLRAMIGLTTNVGDLTRAAWLNKQKHRLHDDLNRWARDYNNVVTAIDAKVTTE